MLKSNYLFYKKYIKNKCINGADILISKTNSSYLIGPLINSNFDEYSFYKRLVSNSVYSLKIYKNFSKRKCLNLIYKYKNYLQDNEVIEVFKNGSYIIHKIIKVPGDIYEKE